MTTYIAGPMTGYPDFNYPMFKTVATQLRSQGIDVVSPTEHTNDKPPDAYSVEKPYAYYLRQSLRMLLNCNEIVLLPGWEQSGGAQLERQIAEALDMCITEYGKAE